MCVRERKAVFVTFVALMFLILPFFFCSHYRRAAAEMSVRMSNLDNERDDRDEDSHEDRGISELGFC